jgi:hypothetical protein
MRLNSVEIRFCPVYIGAMVTKRRFFEGKM